MVPFYRIDNRLVHGQIISTWMPHLRLKRVLIASDTVPLNRLQMSMFRMVIPKEIAFDALPVEEAGQFLATGQHHGESTLVLFEELSDALRFFEISPFSQLNIGNVHHRPDRKRYTNAVYLSEDELSAARSLLDRRAHIEIRSLPTETAIDLGAILGSA